MKNFPTIEKLVASAVKGGCNEKEVRGMIERQYVTIKRLFPNRTTKELIHSAFILDSRD